jgi:hypothetical protein
MPFTSVCISVRMCVSECICMSCVSKLLILLLLVMVSSSKGKVGFRYTPKENSEKTVVVAGGCNTGADL